MTKPDEKLNSESNQETVNEAQETVLASPIHLQAKRETAVAIRDTTSHIAEILHQVSGLPDFEERVCAYYCLSSWFVNQINPFPILNLTGPNATGKSSSLAVFRRLAFQPYGFTATDMSGPVIRDELGKAHNATAVIEEADNAKGDIESFLGLRYMRETAIVTKKIPAGPGAWKTIYIPIYGSSIIHKRIPFKDPAVEGRSITINTVSDISRKYKRAENLKDELIDEVRLEEAKAKASVKLPENLEIPEDIAPRVVDCYRPLIALANVGKTMNSWSLYGLGFGKQLKVW